jgi:hypothetical protein
LQYASMHSRAAFERSMPAAEMVAKSPALIPSIHSLTNTRVVLTSWNTRGIRTSARSEKFAATDCMAAASCR